MQKKGQGMIELTREQLAGLSAKTRAAIKNGKLTEKEEHVLRMRFGLAETDDAEIEFRGQNNDLTRVRLARMEKEIIDRMRATRGPNPRRDRLVRALKDLQ